MLSPYQFKPGQDFSQMLRFILTVGLFFNIYYMHVMSESP